MTDDLAPIEPDRGMPTRRRGTAPDLDRFLDLDRSTRAATLVLPPMPLRRQFTVEDYWTQSSAVRGVEHHGREIDARLGECLPADTVRHITDLAREAATAKPDRRVVMAAVALFVGSRARQPENPQTFIRALEFDLVDLGFSPTVVVVALQRLRREAKFIPEIPEVIAACEVERKRLRFLLEQAGRATQWRAGLEAERAELPTLLAQAEALPEEQPPIGQSRGARR